MTEATEKPTRTHNLHAYTVLSLDWLTKHEPRTIEHEATDPDGNVSLSLMTEVGDGTFVAWTDCRRCAKRFTLCACAEGPQEPDYIERWKAKRFDKSFDGRPDLSHEREVTEKVVATLRDRGYVVGEIPEPIIKEVPVETDSLFVELFNAVAACEAPEGTQVDDVLGNFQERYDEITGHITEAEERIRRAGLGPVDGPETPDVLPKDESEPAPYDGGSEPDADDLADARDDLGEEATEDEVQHVAEQRASVREEERKLDDIQVDF